jgi:hypothetical protein
MTKCRRGVNSLLVQDSLLPLEQASRLLRKRLYRIDLFLLPATLLEFQEWL